MPTVRLAPGSRGASRFLRVFLVAAILLLMIGGSSWPAADSTSQCRRGIITTVAGKGGPPGDPGGYGGDNGPATQARLCRPMGLAVAPDGAIYIAEYGNHRIRKVDPEGMITSIAGAGGQFFTGDGGPAVLAGLWPHDVAVGKDGRVYIADTYNNRIRKIDTAGVITTVAGDGWHDRNEIYRGRFQGDGGPATEASLNQPQGVAVGADGTIYISDSGNNRVREVSPEGVITTIAGTGKQGFSGDGGPAARARLANPQGIAAGLDGSVYVADAGNCRVRRIDAAGIITTVAGGHYPPTWRDGALATEVYLGDPQDVEVGTDGSLYVAGGRDHVVYRVDPAGAIGIIAGTGGDKSGKGSFCGDGGPATKACMYDVQGIAVGPDGSVYAAEQWNHRIRRIAWQPCEP